MKQTKISALTLACIGAQQLISDAQSDLERDFLIYLSKYNKSYSTREEFELRFALFAKSLNIIEDHNQINEDEETLGLNHMADWTHDEYKQLLGYQNNRLNMGKLARKQLQEFNIDDIPESINWVEKGAVTPVKNQFMCGSCWAFSATGSMEGRYQIQNSQLLSLSEQQLLDCSKPEGNHACAGGEMDNAFKYAEQHAMETEDQYPYNPGEVQATCDMTKTGKVQISNFTDVQQKSPSALASAVSKGPVSVGMDASAIKFRYYHKGIMKSKCGTDLDHGVLVVGYGTEGGVDYWLLKNSFGHRWGEKGYFRMIREMDKENDPGHCGIQLGASYPEF